MVMQECPSRWVQTLHAAGDILTATFLELLTAATGTRVIAPTFTDWGL